MCEIEQCPPDDHLREEGRKGDQYIQISLYHTLVKLIHLYICMYNKYIICLIRHNTVLGGLIQDLPGTLFPQIICYRGGGGGGGGEITEKNTPV